MKITAIILAAGTATRLRPLTDNTPKCLLPVGDKTILSRTIENLRNNNIKDIIIVTGFLESMIKTYVSTHFPELKISYVTNHLFSSTNNAWSLMLALEKLPAGKMILLDSDIVFDEQIIKKILDSGYSDCLALRASNQLGIEEIKVLADNDNRITAISKIVNPEDSIGESIGIELFSENGCRLLYDTCKSRMEKGFINEFYEASFEEMIQNGFPFYAVNINPLACMEIDTADDLNAAALLVPQLT